MNTKRTEPDPTVTITVMGKAAINMVENGRAIEETAARIKEAVGNNDYKTARREAQVLALQAQDLVGDLGTLERLEPVVRYLQGLPVTVSDPAMVGEE